MKIQRRRIMFWMGCLGRFDLAFVWYTEAMVDILDTEDFVGISHGVYPSRENGYAWPEMKFMVFDQAILKVISGGIFVDEVEIGGPDPNSSSTLRVAVLDKSITISDKDDRSFRFLMFLDKKQVQIGSRVSEHWSVSAEYLTRKPDGTRHPVLNARALALLSAEHFNSVLQSRGEGERVTMLLGNWSNENGELGDNIRRFKHNLGKQMPESEFTQAKPGQLKVAALDTPTARIAKTVGFTGPTVVLPKFDGESLVAANVMFFVPDVKL